jgi:hypothetical protein
MARSADGGATFGPNVRVDDFMDLERLNERPTIAADRRGHVHVAWTDLRAREPDTNIFYARSENRGASFSPSRQLDDSKVDAEPDRQAPSNQWHPSLVADGQRLFVTWQDNRLGNNDVFFSLSTDGGRTFSPGERVDDTGGGASSQVRPSLSLGGRRAAPTCHVVWEDDRDGTTAVFLGRRDCRG